MKIKYNTLREQKRNLKKDSNIGSIIATETSESIHVKGKKKDMYKYLILMPLKQALHDLG